MPHFKYDPQHETGGYLYDSRRGYFPYRFLEEFLQTLPIKKRNEIVAGLEGGDIEVEVQNVKYAIHRSVDGQTFCKIPASGQLERGDPYVPVWQNISTGIIYGRKDNDFIPYLSETFPKVKSYEILDCVKKLCDQALVELEDGKYKDMQEFGEKLRVNLYRGLESILKLHVPEYKVDYDAVLPSIFYNPFDDNKSIAALNEFVRLVHKLKHYGVGDQVDVISILSKIGRAINKAENKATEESGPNIILHIINEDLGMAKTLDSHMSILSSQLDALINELRSEGANAGDGLGINFLVRYKGAIEKYNYVVKDVLSKKDSDPNIVEYLTALYSSEEFKSAFLELYVCDRISREVGLQPDIASQLGKGGFDYAMTINQRATRLVMPWQQVSDKVRVEIYTDIYNAADNIRQLGNLALADTYVVNPSDFKLFKVNDEIQNNMLLCYGLSKKIAQRLRLPAHEQNPIELQNMMSKFNGLYKNVMPLVCVKQNNNAMQNICDVIKAADDYIRYTMPNLDDATNYDMDVRIEKAALADEYIKYQTYKTGSIDFRKATTLVNEFSVNGVPLTKTAKQILSESKQYDQGISRMEHMSKPLFQAKLYSIPVVDVEAYRNPEPGYTITDVQWGSIKEDVQSTVDSVNYFTKASFIVKDSTTDLGAIDITREITISGNQEEQRQFSLKNNGSTLSAVLGHDLVKSMANMDYQQSTLLTNLMQVIQNHAKGAKIEISNCAGRPEVARKMFDVAVKAGMQPVYKNDGSDPRNIFKRTYHSISPPGKRLRGP